METVEEMSVDFKRICAHDMNNLKKIIYENESMCVSQSCTNISCAQVHDLLTSVRISAGLLHTNV